MRKKRGHKHAMASRFRARCCRDLPGYVWVLLLLLGGLIIGKKCSLSALLILDADVPLFGARRGLPPRLPGCSRLLPIGVDIIASEAGQLDDSVADFCHGGFGFLGELHEAGDTYFAFPKGEHVSF